MKQIIEGIMKYYTLHWIMRIILGMNYMLTKQQKSGKNLQEAISQHQKWILQRLIKRVKRVQHLL